MPYPSSFETVSVIRPRAHVNLDPARVSTLLERAFTAGGSTVTNSDGTYFEFRRPYGSARIPWLVRAGTIRTESRGDSIEVKGEALVRLGPGLLALLVFTAFPALVGARPMDSVLSLLVSGGVIQFLYLRAVFGFSKYVAALCSQVSSLDTEMDLRA